MIDSFFYYNHLINYEYVAVPNFARYCFMLPTEFKRAYLNFVIYFSTVYLDLLQIDNFLNF